MRDGVNGFEVEVTVKDAIPHVRISFSDGTVAVDTSALSVKGMENIAVAFTYAARMAYNQLDIYWQRKHKEATLPCIY